MSATARQVDAYRRRLAKIDHSGDLTAECLNAVIAFEVNGLGGEQVTGTLVAYSHAFGPSIIFGGQRLVTDVRVCPDCAHRTANCRPDTELPWHRDVFLIEVRRNGDPRCTSCGSDAQDGPTDSDGKPWCSACADAATSEAATA